MTLIEIFSIMILHWIADFILQTDKQALNKSKDIRQLSYHVLSYTTFMTVALMVWGALVQADEKTLLLIPITFICHWTTDFFTSKVSKQYFESKNYHMGFIVVGFDQILHYAQLFLCWWWFVKN